MPQSTQHFLIHILLLWTTVISIIQVVIITLFFTVGHKGLSQNSIAVEPSKLPQEQITTLQPPDHELELSKGKMISFKAKNGSSQINWAETRNQKLMKVEDGILTAEKDGYYFLNLRVTTLNSEDLTVHLVSKSDGKDKVLLTGWINKITNSTGILSKVVELGSGSKLVTQINPAVSNGINSSETVTHLDIIFMLKPQM